MINTQQLRQLGWNEDLIAEIERLALKIESSAVKAPITANHLGVTAATSSIFVTPNSAPNATSHFLSVWSKD